MNETIKNLDYYIDLPYAIVLRKDEVGDWIAKVEDLPGCVAHGATHSEALENIEETKRGWIEDALEVGDAIPEPREDTSALPSGKWLQRVPKSLHKRLAEMAQRESVSLNQFVMSILAEAVGKGAMIVSRVPRVQEARTMLLHSGVMERKRLHGFEMYFDTFNKEEPRALWKVKHANSTFVLDICDVLNARVVSLPDQLVESDFKVNDNASKKELAFKA